MEIKDKVGLNKITHSVRASQAVLQYGVGAMVDFPEQTLMTAAPETWSGSVMEIHDERLEKLLHVDYFGMPGSKDEGRYQDGVSYVRFPEWYFCPRCRRFQPLKEWIKEYRSVARNARFIEKDPYMVKHVKCSRCFQDLVVTRLVTVCSNGHIDDFPWIKWVHAQNLGGSRNICSDPKLKFTTSASSSAGLEGLTISCTTCNCRATLKNSFENGILEEIDKRTGFKYGFQCAGRHPWKNTKEPCGEYPRVLQRGGSSVYFPNSVSSLVIPPYSSQLTSLVYGSVGFSELRTEIRGAINTLNSLPIQVDQEMKQAAILQKISEFASRIAAEIGRREDQVKPILERRWSGNDEEDTSTGSVKYRAEEYVALNGEVAIDDPNGEFVRESTDIAEYGLPFIKSISLIHKVREVQALIGFSRLEPIDKDASSEGKIKEVPIKENNTRWYPGYDVRGEGIFIELDENAIDDWRTSNDRIQRRVDQLNENYMNSYYGAQRPREITAKFLLIHTLSHILMKQLSFECGYNIASIKERIYCSEPSEGKSMSGIFIYTASGDSEGTMGGLVRQGRPDVFPAVFKKAIEASITCSNDPVCSLSMGQGRDSLNLAACYSCCLVPETSCEEFNVFLDRATIIGNYEDRDFGFYSDYAYGKKEWGDSELPHTDDSTSGNLQTNGRNALIITDPGTSMTNMTYNEIWAQIKQFSSNETEQIALEQLINRSDELEENDHPFSSGTFQILGDSNYYFVDLLWTNSNIMVFSDDYRDEYKKASKTEWRCFLLSEKGCVDRIIAAIKGE